MIFRPHKALMDQHRQNNPAGEDYRVVLEIHVLTVVHFHLLQPFDLQENNGKGYN